MTPTVCNWLAILWQLAMTVSGLHFFFCGGVCVGEGE